MRRAVGKGHASRPTGCRLDDPALTTRTLTGHSEQLLHLRVSVSLATDHQRRLRSGSFVTICASVAAGSTVLGWLGGLMGASPARRRSVRQLLQVSCARRIDLGVGEDVHGHESLLHGYA